MNFFFCPLYKQPCAKKDFCTPLPMKRRDFLFVRRALNGKSGREKALCSNGKPPRRCICLLRENRVFTLSADSHSPREILHLVKCSIVVSSSTCCCRETLGGMSVERRENVYEEGGMCSVSSWRAIQTETLSAEGECLQAYSISSVEDGGANKKSSLSLY